MMITSGLIAHSVVRLCLAGLLKHMALFHQQNRKSITEAETLSLNGPSEESIIAASP